MGFKLRDVVTHLPAIMEVRFTCPTNKLPFDTKEEARAMLRRANRSERTNMRAYRCPYCAKIHVGHSRGR